MHDAAFASAALQSPVTILKLALRPYSVGHELWLQAENNPLNSLQEPLPNSRILGRHVVEAVWICAHSWRELRSMHQAWLTPFKIAAWRRRNRGADLAPAAADFQNYRRAGSTAPPMGPIDGAGRDLGGPPLAGITQFLLESRLALSADEAMDFPLGLAYWHYAVHREGKGALKILNAGEMEFEEWCEGQEREAGAKSEGRNPKSEGSPKSENRRPEASAEYAEYAKAIGHVLGVVEEGSLKRET